MMQSLNMRFCGAIQQNRKYAQFAKAPHGNIPYTNVLKPTHNPMDPEYKIIPAYQVLPLKTIPNYISKDIAHKILTTMVKNRTLDSLLYNLQRQGRISFYMTSLGEEAAIVASTAALASNDVIFTQYREQASFLYRGLSIQDIVDQLFSNKDDPGKGRQMPLHYGSVAYHMPTVSAPLATQLPHAVGTAYSLKMAGESNDNPHIIKKEHRLAILEMGAQVKETFMLH